MLVNYLNFEFWFYQIYLLLNSVYYFIVNGASTETQPIWIIIGIISILGSFIFFIWLLYSLYKLQKLRKKEEADFIAGFVVAANPKSEEAEEWQDILDHIDSENEAQWKLALIDADKILENLLRENGYGGVGVGESLKLAETQGGIKSLQDAWQAHKTRNRIAHEPGFVLTKREAKIAVESYKKVFEELGFL
ncbi:MAG: hypothetical protein Q7S19_02780 [bacterium]|nr:hypothetical protein [bacterium]